MIPALTQQWEVWSTGKNLTSFSCWHRKDLESWSSELGQAAMKQLSSARERLKVFHSLNLGSNTDRGERRSEARSALISWNRMSPCQMTTWYKYLEVRWSQKRPLAPAHMITTLNKTRPEPGRWRVLMRWTSIQVSSSVLRNDSLGIPWYFQKKALGQETTRPIQPCRALSRSPNEPQTCFW